MTTIINTGTTITEPFNVKLQDTTIQIGGTAGLIPAIIFSGDALLSASQPSLDSASVITEQVPGQTTAETALLQTLGVFVNAGTIAADGPALSQLTIDIGQFGSGSPGNFINNGLITVAVGDTALVTVGTNAAFTMGVGPLGAAGTLAVAGGGALDIGTPGSDAATGAVNVAGGQSVIGTGTIEAAVVNDGVVGISNTGTIATSTVGSLEITGSVSGSGTLVLGSGTLLQLDGASTGQSIQFTTGAPEILVINAPGTAFSEPISNFQDLDSIILGGGITVTNAVIFNGDTLRVNTTSGPYFFTDFGLASNSGTLLTVTNQNTITLSNRVFNWHPLSGSTDLGTATNWLPLNGSPPGPNDLALFGTAASTGVITGTATVGELQFDGSQLWTISGGDIDYTLNVLVGQPDGTLTLSNGATLDGLSSEADLIGSGTDAVAAATVTGPGTTWETLGTIAVGELGAGALTVSNHGLVDAASAIVVGGSTQGNGAMSLETGATAIAGGQVIVGNQSGTNGSIEILADSTLETGTSGASNVEIGLASGANGAIAVNGTGAALDTFGSPISVGIAGAGAILVENGAIVSTENGLAGAPGGVMLGTSSGGAGAATVTGTGSELANTGAFIVGGNDTGQPGGFGSLLISAGGLVSTSLPVGVSGPAADIAASTSTDGSSATVTGPASTWSIGGTLIVGDLAAGALNVSAGGSVSATALTLGNSAGGVGVLSLSGTASNVTLATQLTVGGSGIADISIANGATLSGTDGDIGLGTGSSGVIDIEGANSRLDLSDNLNIGDAGTGVLIMGANTTLSVENNLNIGAAGALNQFGGVIDPAMGTIQAGGSLGGTGGTDTFTNFLLNDGVFYASGTVGPETLNAGSITGTGSLVVNNDGTLVINAGSVVATQTVEFTNTGTPAVLQIGTLGGFGAALGNFNGLDSVVVQGVSIGSDGYTPGSGGADGVLTLFSAVGQGGSVLGTLNVAPAFPVGDVAALEVVTNGTIGGVPCFAAGTRIETERGLVAVEALAVGDRVRLAPDGPDGAGSLAVVWIGRRVVDCRHHPKPRAMWPVRVRAGAFGAGCPGRDVYLSPDHAVYAEGVLIPVKYLVDGDSVTQVAVDQVGYFHVELERHAVLLAEGLAAESYLDTGDRSSFSNGGGAVRLHADFASLRWEAQGCAPLVVTGAEVERVKQMLARSAAASEAA